MIRKLSIEHYALIDRLEIDFDAGFSVVTGETGAGKSIILGALGLILGERADSKSIQEGASKCVIEGVFDIAAYGLESFFTEHDLEYDGAHCILRRELLASGKSRAFVNDSPTPLALLKALGEKLIDVHSQHQNLLLSDGRFQLHVLDTLGGTETLYARYREEFSHYNALRRKLTALRDTALKERREEEFLRFQYNQLQDAAPEADEQEALEEEQRLLTHAQEIKTTLAGVAELLDGEEQGLLQALKEAVTKARSAASLYARAGALADRLESNYIDLKELARESNREEEQIVCDNRRLEEVEARLDLLFRLQQKFQVRNNRELLARKQEIETALGRIDRSDEAIAALERETEGQYATTTRTAGELTERRQEAARTISARIEAQIRPLGMPHGRLETELQPLPQLGPSGAEQVRFRFAANKNQTLQPIAEVASGGEISRVMLVLKALIADVTALPTLIFDEVDSGVSGEIADKMGTIMRQLGDALQVIAITHLPQAAAQGKNHYKVYKTEGVETTHTAIRRLSDEERLQEIAGMLSGTRLTEAALQNAAALLKRN